MELKLFLGLVWKQRVAIGITSLIFALLGGIIALQWPTVYVASHSVYIQKIPEKPAIGDFTYDGYYAQQAAELYTDTVVGLFESPALMARTLELVDKPNDAKAVEDFQRKISAKKVAPRIIEVQIKNTDAQEASILATTLFQAVNERVTAFSAQDESQSMKIDVVNTTPLVSQDDPSAVLFTIIGLMIGICVSIGFVMTKEYLLSE